jgi:hypothetical protein
MPLSSIDIFRPICDAINCAAEAKHERKITVRDMQGEPLTFTAFFCEKHKDEAKTRWDDKPIQ